MPEGKKPVVPAPAASAAAKEDSYSAKTHLHQPVPVTEMATVAATALPANAPEGTLPSEVRPEIVTWEKLVEAIKASGKAYNMAMIEKAYNMANDAHKGVCRRSGEPYICHPLAVARLVLDLGMDSESIAAALLHDVVEDTPTTLTDLTAAFGEEVAALVDGVTKLTKIQFSNIEELQAENLRKMLLAMSRDVRVMIIKLCDRLHNMRTGDAWPEQKRRDKARETMEVYAPIANRLGILNVKEELEDRSLHYLDPVGYEEINKMLSERAGDEFLASVSGVIKSRLEESGIEGATIKRRVKSIYGIYRKTIMQNKSFDEIYDIYAVRIILDTLAECYSTLGLIHDMYHPLPNRFKDYISTPKPNGYQSLHTTVIGREGIPFEVQIRTWEMHHTAEYGIAAHWKYKQGMANAKLGTEEAFEWVRKLLESQQDVDAEEFVRTMRVDLFADEVFVFPPRGDVINLPAGATPIDFAYNIHSAVGNHMTGAKVNGRMVTFDTPLKNGDIVEVITSKSAHGPSRDWMKICKSNEARNKIRQWFKKERREENIATGRASFESELKHVGLSLAAITAEDVLPFILRKVRFGTLDELYAAIGYGGMSAQKAVVRVKDEMARLDRLHAEQSAAAQEPIHPSTSNPPTVPIRGGKTSQSGIIVEGIDNCLVKFAKCCTPVPGDPVVGFITRGFGVSVHRADCPNASDAKRAEEPGRWIRVDWATGELASYQTALDISAKARDGLTLDVAMTLSAAKVKTTSLSARSMPDGYATVSIVLEVKNQEELTNVINKLGQIQGVYQVKRASG